MKAEEALSALEDHQQGPIDPALVTAVVGLLPQLLDLISRKPLKRQVEVIKKTLQAVVQKNKEQDETIASVIASIKAHGITIVKP